MKPFSFHGYNIGTTFIFRSISSLLFTFIGNELALLRSDPKLVYMLARCKRINEIQYAH